MNLESIRRFMGDLSLRDLPQGAAIAIAVLLLFLVFKTGKFFLKVVLLLLAAGLFAGAYWWHVRQ